MSESPFTKIEDLAALLISRGKWLSTAESCTGGGLGHTITSLSGSSAWYLGGVVSYSNQLKQDLLNVSDSSLSNFGAVSEQVAEEMASGVAMVTAADYAVSTTGIAGPDGGTDDKPVGTVCFGYFLGNTTQTETCHFSGNRDEVRAAAIAHSITKLIDLISK